MEKLSGRPPVIANIMFEKHKEKMMGNSLHDVFSFIYQDNLWSSGESVSGVGSELNATELIRRDFPELIQDFQITSILDIPCGDFTWMKEISFDIPYTGCDIVPEIVNRNILQYGNPGKIDFTHLDLTASELPKKDLLFCRDCLVHFSLQNIHKALDNIKKSQCVYLLCTSFTELEINIDITDGDWRPLNFQKAPFFFPKPLAVIVEGCQEEEGAYADKSLCLWKIMDLP